MASKKRPKSVVPSEHPIATGAAVGAVVGAAIGAIIKAKQNMQVEMATVEPRSVPVNPSTGSNTTLEYFDGFDDYDINRMIYYWQGTSMYGDGSGWNFFDSISGGISLNTAGQGRNGTNHVIFGTSYTSGIYTKGRLGSIPTRTVGAAFRYTGSYVDDIPWLFVFLDGKRSQVCLSITKNLSLQVSTIADPPGGWDHSGGIGRIILGPSTQKFTQGVWHYVEMSVTIHPTAGSVTVKVDDVIWLTGTGLNTQDTANSTCDGVSVGQNVRCYGSPTLELDDFYMRGDGLFCGADVQVITSFASGVGDVTQMVRMGTDRGQNYLQVNEKIADLGTTIVAAYSSTSNFEDTYVYQPVPTGQVLAVMVCAQSTVQGSGGVVQVTPIYRIGGVTYPGNPSNVNIPLFTGYWTTTSDIQGFDPSTNQPWTAAGRNAAQFGMRRTSD